MFFLFLFFRRDLSLTPISTLVLIAIKPMKKKTNFLLILSDEHQKYVSGCYGNAQNVTPSLDALAARGTRFSRAYTTCPICVPARASLATGKYVHEIGNWDNAFPYDGSERSWHHEVRDAGLTVDLIGKLHFRSEDDDNGYSQEHQPLHVVNGIGDPFGCLRQDPPVRFRREGINSAGEGDTTYQQYDVRNADKAIDWLDEHREDEQPWTLFLSLVCPHPPYKVKREYLDLFDPDKLPRPPQWKKENWPTHPHYEYMRKYFDATEQHTNDQIKNLIHAYYGLTRFLDDQIGRVLQQLEALGLDENTRIIYSTDHGECLSARGLFGKFTHYEESGGVPMILAGPDVPEGSVCDTPVSLLDVHATIYDSLGLDLPIHRNAQSLIELARQPERQRSVFGEYHALNSENGSFLLTDNRFKLIYHANQSPQLFDLSSDPDEINDLSENIKYKDTLDSMIVCLREICDPEAIDAQAKADQKALINRFGGEAEVRERGFFENSPVPGESPKFKS